MVGQDRDQLIFVFFHQQHFNVPSGGQRSFICGREYGEWAVTFERINKSCSGCGRCNVSNDPASAAVDDVFSLAHRERGGGECGEGGGSEDSLAKHLALHLYCLAGHTYARLREARWEPSAAGQCAAHCQSRLTIEVPEPSATTYAFPITDTSADVMERRVSVTVLQASTCL